MKRIILVRNVINYTFSQFYEYEYDDENVVAVFVQDETDENIFIYVSKELNVEYETLFADSIEDVKHQIEDMLIDHWNEEINYLENRIKSFQGEYYSKEEK